MSSLNNPFENQGKRKKTPSSHQYHSILNITQLLLIQMALFVYFERKIGQALPFDQDQAFWKIIKFIFDDSI